MKRVIVILIVPLTTIALTVGCFQRMSPMEQTFHQLAPKLPLQIIFERIDPTVKDGQRFDMYTRTTVKINKEQVGSYIKASCAIAQQPLFSLGYEHQISGFGLGKCLDTTQVPDSLNEYLVAWIIKAARLANGTIQEQQEHGFLMSIKLESHWKTMMSTEYGQVEIEKLITCIGDVQSLKQP